MSKNSLALDNIKRTQRSERRQKNVDVASVGERSRLQRFVKRSLDILISISVIVLGFPFFLAISIFIKLTSKGPVFFKQERIGENGEPFVLLKLRTMRIDADDSHHKEFCEQFIKGNLEEEEVSNGDASVYKIVDDPRITGIGKFLRKSSLDELPQFINILKGEMTLVGPRPPLKYEYKHYDNWHKLRLKVRPGLTGLWQVSGRSSVSFQEMVMLDLYYIENWSLMMDIRIVLNTIPVMLKGSGGY
jgi:lipopolysaccharide/colanic/teichoic acid biosynthesis glycosyltransferase